MAAPFVRLIAYTPRPAPAEIEADTPNSSKEEAEKQTFRQRRPNSDMAELGLPHSTLTD
jgi:hypothetical protein